MSEHVFTHYRTGTFTLTADGMPARFVRDHHAIHLFLPETVPPPAEVLAAIPASLRPSQEAALHRPARSNAACGALFVHSRPAGRCGRRHATGSRRRNARCQRRHPRRNSASGPR